MFLRIVDQVPRSPGDADRVRLDPVVNPAPQLFR
jgi:hypothetical protein